LTSSCRPRHDAHRARRTSRGHAGQPVGAQERPGRAVRFSTLTAICDVLDCQPGDVLRCAPRRERSATRTGEFAATK
jgi:hypothetical protein